MSDKGKRTQGAALGLLGAACLLLAACGPSSQANEVEAGNDGFVKVVNVEVETLRPTDFTSYVRLTGEVEAMNDVVVSAEESGVIERFYVEKGDFVKAGQAIAKIRDRVLRAQVEEAEAAAKLAAERYERQRRLWEEEGIGSEITYLEAKYEARLQAARLANLQARLERTRLESPIAGVFDEKYVDAGEMIAPGGRVARVVEVGRVKVTGGVPERFALAVERGDTARITFDVLPNRTFVGSIGFVGRTVDRRNRTFPIEIVMENPGGVVKPLMVASVEVAAERRRDVLVVPQDAISRTETGYQVFVVEAEDGSGVARPRTVRLGPSYANRAVVEAGLEPGDRLIVRGQQLVEAGDHVRILEPVAAEPETG